MFSMTVPARVTPLLTSPESLFRVNDKTPARCQHARA